MSASASRSSSGDGAERPENDEHVQVSVERKRAMSRHRAPHLHRSRCRLSLPRTLAIVAPCRAASDDRVTSGRSRPVMFAPASAASMSRAVTCAARSQPSRSSVGTRTRATSPCGRNVHERGHALGLAAGVDHEHPRPIGRPLFPQGVGAASRGRIERQRNAAPRAGDDAFGGAGHARRDDASRW